MYSQVPTTYCKSGSRASSSGVGHANQQCVGFTQSTHVVGCVEQISFQPAGNLLAVNVLDVALARFSDSTFVASTSKPRQRNPALVNASIKRQADVAQTDDTNRATAVFDRVEKGLATSWNPWNMIPPRKSFLADRRSVPTLKTVASLIVDRLESSAGGMQVSIPRPWADRHAKIRVNR